MNKNAEMKRFTFDEAKQISIVEYLSSVGFEPARIRGVDHWYHAPGRPDLDPSFKVDTNLNLWYDHGDGIGGTIIELGMRLHQCSPVEFLKKLSEGNYQNDLVSMQRSFFPKKRDNEVEIRRIKSLTNEDLLFYINQRGINNRVATQHCKEVEFSIRGKGYSAIGFQNRAGGWELRNAWFKGSSTPKDITVLRPGSSGRLTISEGFIDHLSLLETEDQRIKSVIEGSDFMILNSLSFLHRSYDLLKSYSELNFFLDNDTAGEKAKANLISDGIQFIDRSDLYQGHKDVNEFLVNTIRNAHVVPSYKKPKGLSL